MIGFVLAFGALLLCMLAVIVVVIMHERSGAHGLSDIPTWRELTRRIDELTNRNATALGSLRSSLETQAGAFAQSCAAIDELVKNNHQMQSEVWRLQESFDKLANQRQKRSSLEPPPIDARGLGDTHSIVDARAITNRVPYLAPIGNDLQEQLEHLREEAMGYFPFQRMAYAVIDSSRQNVTTMWQYCDRETSIKPGYKVGLRGSLRLAGVRNQPIVFSDLQAYLANRPQSETTKMLIADGFRSSLACPVCADGHCVGFLFFNSEEREAFSDEHVANAKRVADEIGILQRRLDSRMPKELAGQSQ